jgi:hypothetical protein
VEVTRDEALMNGGKESSNPGTISHFRRLISDPDRRASACHKAIRSVTHSGQFAQFALLPIPKLPPHLFALHHIANNPFCAFCAFSRPLPIARFIGSSFSKAQALTIMLRRRGVLLRVNVTGKTSISANVFGLCYAVTGKIHARAPLSMKGV